MVEETLYDGYTYKVMYQPNLSRNTYTQHRVYFVETDDESYPHAHRAIEDIMNDGSWREGYYHLINKQEPSMLNGLHSYHKFSYDEEKDCFIYELVIPYDD